MSWQSVHQKTGSAEIPSSYSDCMLSHGVAGFLRERMYDCSDAYRMHVCDICGLAAIANLKKQSFECRACRNKTESEYSGRVAQGNRMECSLRLFVAVSQVSIPYAAKLLFQELQAMNVSADVAGPHRQAIDFAVNKQVACRFGFEEDGENEARQDAPM